jgi:hypothetical protein
LTLATQEAPAPGVDLALIGAGSLLLVGLALVLVVVRKRRSVPKAA